MLASFRMAATIAFFARYREPSGNTKPCGSELARDSGVSANINVECDTAIASKLSSYRGYVPIQQIPGKKKPDLAKAFNRATALRSNKCKGRFDARKALKGLRQVT
ncbi:hypothetical protein [Pseudomonas rossensis]|uniref:hypothetical protein n=1 Tax=Pseudomonas rossensis TaxID=2305471 RepID=UPI003260C5BD